MKSNLVSICIPVYNGENTIKNTIMSALNQTYDNIEVIVVDNCSNDNTLNICKEINDDRLHVYQNAENIGMLGNWNKVVEYATGEYIHMLCSDDLLHKDCIERKMQDVDKDEKIAFVFGASEVINPDGDVLMTRYFKKESGIHDGRTIAKQSFRSRNFLGEPSNVLFKKELFNQVGGVNTKLLYTPDWDLWIRIALLGKVYYESTPLVQYRISADNATSSFSIGSILKDDKSFVSSVEAAGLEVSVWDKNIHKISIFIRTYMRRLYMKIKL